MPNNVSYDQTNTRVNGTTEKEFDELGKDLKSDFVQSIYYEIMENGWHDIDQEEEMEEDNKIEMKNAEERDNGTHIDDAVSKHTSKHRKAIGLSADIKRTDNQYKFLTSLSTSSNTGNNFSSTSMDALRIKSPRSRMVRFRKLSNSAYKRRYLSCQSVASSCPASAGSEASGAASAEASAACSALASGPWVSSCTSFTSFTSGSFTSSVFMAFG